MDERAAPGGGAAEAHVQSRQTRDMVQRCIARLPDAYRIVLVLRDIEDRDTAEVAEVLDVTSNAVKIRLHRARQALRTLIERERRGDVGRCRLAARSRDAAGAARPSAGPCSV